MESNLQPTFYCDINHPSIVVQAARLRKDRDDPVAIARRTFYFVRDRIRFGFDRYRRMASDTLTCGYGVCWNKSLLLVALLRCNRIPARFGSVPVKRSFNQPALGCWHWLASHPFHHCLVHAWLNHRWTVLDAVLDNQTYNAFFLPAGVHWSIDWNGMDDVRLYTESIIGKPVVHGDIDAALEKKVGNRELPGYLATLGYTFINQWMWRKVAANSTIRPTSQTGGITVDG